MFCAISGKPPRVPVLSPSSRCVFEKQLIEEYIHQEGKDPVNGTDLTIDQLIPIAQTPEQTALANNLNSSTLNANYSIPNLLASLQNEWDAVMLENFKLRKQLDQFTKQLSTALYQRDAAKIVAARALEANDELKREMARLVSQLGSTIDQTDVETNGTKDNLLERLRHDSETYLAQTRKVKSDFNISSIAPFQLGAKYSVRESLKLHRATSLRHGKQQRLVFQLADVSRVSVSDGPSSFSTIEIPLEDEVDYMTCTANGEQLLFSIKGKFGIYDLTSRETRYTEAGEQAVIFMASHEEILKDHFLWADKTGSIGFTSLDGESTSVLVEGTSKEEFFTASHHKDGLLFALASQTEIKIYDLSRPNEVPTVFRLGEQIKTEGEIKRVQFSSNGYWMVVQSGDFVMSFDLRKEPGTLAVDPFPLENEIGQKLWDMDVSGKNLVLLSGTSEKHYTLTFYEFRKSLKTWKLLDRSLDLEIEKNFEEIDSFLMLFTKEGPLLAVKSPHQVALYITK